MNKKILSEIKEEIYKIQSIWIIGNGFDIGSGLSTKFSNFLEWYLKQPNKDPNISSFKSRINNNLDNWNDLEIQLGKDTTNFNDLNMFEKCFIDLKSNLLKFIHIREIEDRINYSSVEPYFDNIEMDNTVFIVLNYTRNFERFIRQKYQNHTPTIIYPHGTIDADNIVLGVGWYGDVANEIFKKDKAFCHKFLKSKMDIYSELPVQFYLMNTKEIHVYGSSLGQSDGFLWTLIFKRKLLQGKNDFKILFYNFQNNEKELDKTKKNIFSNCCNDESQIYIIKS